LPWIYSPFPFFMEFRNGILLQLFECIESTQNEVKRKMIVDHTCNAVRKSLHASRARKFSRRWSIVVGRRRTLRTTLDNRLTTIDERLSSLSNIYNEGQIQQRRLSDDYSKERNHGQFY